VVDGAAATATPSATTTAAATATTGTYKRWSTKPPFREGFGMGGRPAGLLTRGSPSAAFPSARLSGVVAKGISSHSGGTVPDLHRVPSPLARIDGEYS
jgi:hypothetical protein